MSAELSKDSTGFHKRRAEIQEGVSCTFLGQVFHMAPSAVRRKINSLKPVGERGGDPIYDLAEAAQFLVKPRIDLAEYIKTLRPQDVPVALQKQLWDSQNSKLRYMQDAGELWHTHKVQHVVAELFKTIRQRVLLMADTLDRRGGLTDVQRKAITEISDNLLLDLGKAITEQFKDYEAKGERDDVFENGPPQPGPIGDDQEDDEFGGL